MFLPEVLEDQGLLLSLVGQNLQGPAVQLIQEAHWDQEVLVDQEVQHLKLIMQVLERGN